MSSLVLADVELRNGKLVYQTDTNGNRIPDFSYAGFQAGETPIPTIEAIVLVDSSQDDDTQAIQSAIDEVAKRKPNESGFRGAVLLPPGKLKVQGTLRVHASGIVLRGCGAKDSGTTLLATGFDRRSLIEVAGGRSETIGDPISVTDRHLPSNTMKLSVPPSHSIQSGDFIRITQPCTKEWIQALGMNDFGGDRHGPSWRPGSRDLHWIRQVTKIQEHELWLDAPLPLAMDADKNLWTITKLNCDRWIQNVGVENLCIVSTFEAANVKDEEHAWQGITFQNVRDGWARRIACQHLVSSAVSIADSCSRITVEDCKCLAPIGEVGGHRRYSFYNAGQQVLLQRLYSESGYHDFATGPCAAGPNAFVQCESRQSLGESGTIDSAASGVLFDRVRIDGHALSLRNRGSQGQGVGWSSFNSVLWNCSASMIHLETPPLARNWAFGAHGEYNGDGTWINSDDNVSPESLYYAQLAERIGKEKALQRSHWIRPPVQGSRASTPEQALEASQYSKQPRVTVGQWIDLIQEQTPIATPTAGLPLATFPSPPEKKFRSNPKPLSIQNGWLVLDGKVAVGREANVPWWNGGVRPDDLSKASPALTRFVPGRSGRGLTDSLEELSTSMQNAQQVSLWQHPPLWYDRRRDDHSRVQRMDGDVVAPFYETPWGRSGQGRASDGLSLWDVTKPNRWYYQRLRQFADIGAEKGLILFNGLYMQHSLLEAGAHYVDAPWRSANNINSIGIPEPVFFAGDKLIYVAEQFYDVQDPTRASLHQRYMRQALDELADQSHIIFFLSEEFTGPLSFMQFWLDTIAEWKKEKGKSPHVALYATKDVTDAILTDAKRSSHVSLIYSRFNGDGWWFQPDGTLYAPQGGKNLAPRQWSRLLKPKNAGFHEVYRAVREYRRRFPDKPFIYKGTELLGWATLLGGGSLASIPTTTEPSLLQALITMRPCKEESKIGLEDLQGNQLLYSETPLSGVETQAIDMQTGRFTDRESKLLWIRAKTPTP